jgi:hypothetical protein
MKKSHVPVLIRPDGYVGFRCTAAETPALEARLHEWFVP